MKNFVKSINEWSTNRVDQNENLIQEVEKYNGAEIFPEWLGKKNFGKQIKDIDDLVVGNAYILFNVFGLGQWDGDFEYSGFKSGTHTFTDDQGEVDDITYSKSEILTMIKKSEIFTQI